MISLDYCKLKNIEFFSTAFAVFTSEATTEAAAAAARAAAGNVSE